MSAQANQEGEHAYAGSQRCKTANTLLMDTVVPRKKSVLTAYKLPAVILCCICGLHCSEDPFLLITMKCKI